MRFKLLSLIIMTSLLAACTTATLEELRHAQPKGSAFQKALSKHYLAFADAEAKAYDWASMKVFSEKGLVAAYGSDPLPEDVHDWSLSDEKATELSAAYADLIAKMTPANKAHQAESLAQAQFSYDCWLEQENEGWQVDDIASCRNRFFSAMNELQGDISGDVQASSYLVLFDSGSAKLNAKGATIVKQAAEELRDDSSEIVLNGHTDRTGDERANMVLSEKRVDVVAALLIKEGIHQTRIREFAFGESDPAIETRDAISNPRNRRVEIVIGQ